MASAHSTMNRPEAGAVNNPSVCTTAARSRADPSGNPRLNGLPPGEVGENTHLTGVRGSEPDTLTRYRDPRSRSACVELSLPSETSARPLRLCSASQAIPAPVRQPTASATSTAGTANHARLGRTFAARGAVRIVGSWFGR